VHGNITYRTYRLGSTIIDSTLLSVSQTMLPGLGLVGTALEGALGGGVSEAVSEATGNGDLSSGKIIAAGATGFAAGLLVGGAESGYSGAGEITKAAVSNLLSAPVGASAAVASSFLSSALR